MGETSSLSFRSNIYPTTRNADLINDPGFLASIYDPEALNVLWQFNGSEGRYLNSHQKAVHRTAMHCMHAVADDYPWGTPVGEARVVCRCEREECPSFTECTGKPGMAHRAASAVVEAGQNRCSVNRKTASKSASISTSHRRASRGDGSQTRDTISARVLSQEEVAKLADRLAKCTREQLYEMFPGRTRADVDREFERLGLAWVLDLASKRQKRADEKRELQESQSNKWAKNQGSRTQGSGKNKQGKPVQNASPNGRQGTPKKRKKRQKKGNKRNNSQFKPWSVSEDVAIRHNYPTHGSDMSQWDRRLGGRASWEIDKRAQILGVRHGS